MTLVTESGLSKSNTRYAQGGIAAAMTRDDSAAMHMADSLRAGAGLYQAKAVETLCVTAPERIRDLVGLGVAFNVRNCEFHPTLLAAPGKPLLVLGAVRGEGAVLLDAYGHRFMQSLHADAELAPRECGRA